MSDILGDCLAQFLSQVLADMDIVVTVSIFLFRSFYCALGSYGPGKSILLAHRFICTDWLHFTLCTQYHSHKDHFGA